MRTVPPLIACAAMLAIAPIPAAGQPASAWLRVEIAQVAPDRLDEYAAVQREMAARAKAGGVAWRLVGRTAEFGDAYRFVIVSPLESFAAFDETADETSATPDATETQTALTTRLDGAVTARRVYAARSLPQLDHPLPADERPGLMMFSLASVVPGREQDYLTLMADDFLPHFEEAGVHHTTGALTFGGPGGFIHVFHLAGFGELDEGSPIVAAVGPEAAQQLTAKLAGVVTSTEQWLARLVPELSFGGWPATSSRR